LLAPQQFGKSVSGNRWLPFGHVQMSVNSNPNDAKANPVVVLAADERFAMPLAVTIRSVLERLATNCNPQIYVLDGGITDETKVRLTRSWPDRPYELTWVTVNPAVFAGMPISGHASVVNYYRLMTPWLLPDVNKVIFLDADLLVIRDLTALWQSKMDSRPCLAVQDCAAPYMDASVALKNYSRCGRHLGATTPVSNYRALGLNPHDAYFNSGVLVLDLEAWRREDLPRQVLLCLERNKDHVRWWDQYALNVVLAGRWGLLDPRWNQGSHIHAFPTWSQSPYDRHVYQQVRDDPFIVHFTTRHKPWVPSCLHPRRREFFDVVDRTDWAAWRPWHANRIATYFELVKAQSRRLRYARQKLTCRTAEWLDRRRPAA
jgi:lipopolysaccharide biosynthesis glycosyltransferase